jgi:hypothetical protein
MLFHLVELLAKNQFWLGLCGAGITIVPVLGIMAVHKEKSKK